MSSAIHHKIIKEIVEEKKKDPTIIAINVFGSVGRGIERPNSDVDIEIISSKAKKWSLVKRKRYGIVIDMETCPKNQLEKRFKTHPFLCYDYLFEKIMYDPKKFMSKSIKRLKSYFDKNPEVMKFWDKKNKLMRKAKNKCQRPEHPLDVWDEAEIKFSKEHKITRDFFRRKK